VGFLLYSIEEHPDVRFTVIVNPGNGPGPLPLPDSNYLDEIPRLTSYPNVQVLGYVHVSYAKRDLAEVTRDVKTYASWTTQHSQHPGLAVEGIFVDETPCQHDPDVVEYLRQLARVTKDCSGFGKNKTVRVVSLLLSF
jgi:hypothetical protein